jgi:DNA-binding LytR/AlgR family response regulator
MMKKIKNKDNYFVFKEAGKEIRILSSEILYVKSAGNYIDIVTINKVYTVREKLSNFISLVPDELEYLRVHRSYVIRIDKVSAKTKKSVFINKEEIHVGETYLLELDKIIF